MRTNFNILWKVKKMKKIVVCLFFFANLIVISDVYAVAIMTYSSLLIHSKASDIFALRNIPIWI